MNRKNKTLKTNTMKITFEDDLITYEKEFKKTFDGKYRVTIGYRDMVGCKCEEIRRHCIVDAEDLLHLVDTKYYDYFRVELDD